MTKEGKFQCPRCFKYFESDQFYKMPAWGREGHCKDCEMRIKESRKEDLIGFIEGMILVAIGFGIVALIVA